MAQQWRHDSRGDGQIDPRQNRVPSHPDMHLLQGNGNAPGSCRPPRFRWQPAIFCRQPSGLVMRMSGSFIQCSKGFEEPQGDVTMGGILPGQQRYLLPKDREVQSPVDEQ